MTYGVGCRRGSDLALLWLWCRRAAVALIGPLALEPPYATGADLKSKKEKKKRLFDSLLSGILLLMLLGVIMTW